MSFKTWFDGLSLEYLFAITAILFLVLGFNAGLIAGVYWEQSEIIEYIDNMAQTELGLIRFDNDYYHVERYTIEKLMNVSEIENLTILNEDK